MAAVPEPDENEILPYQAHTLVTFLAKEPKQILTRLYQAPSSCLAVFRSIFRAVYWTFEFDSGAGS